MATATERARLSTIKSRVADASANWHLGKMGMEIMATVVSGTEPVSIADLTADCSYIDRDLLLNARDDIRFLLSLLQRASDEIRRWKPVENQQQDHAHARGNYAAECAMLCDDQAFRRFLLERKEAPDVGDSIRVKSHVRRLLGVDSRSELNNSAEARNRWFDLRAEFSAWKVSA
jgi:hypothetical protein